MEATIRSTLEVWKIRLVVHVKFASPFFPRRAAINSDQLTWQWWLDVHGGGRRMYGHSSWHSPPAGRMCFLMSSPSCVNRYLITLWWSLDSNINIEGKGWFTLLVCAAGSLQGEGGWVRPYALLFITVWVHVWCTEFMGCEGLWAWLACLPSSWLFSLSLPLTLSLALTLIS